MKSEVWRGQNSTRFIYFRYKDSAYVTLLVLSICLAVCFLLIFQIIIPRTQDWFSIRDEVQATRQQISVLRGNISFMSEMNKNVLESNRQLAIRALPVEKDFGGIIDAVVIAAMNSGTSIDDFSFNLGLVSTSSAALKKHPEANEPLTKLSLSVSGDLDKIKNFITEIGEKLPISEIESVDVGKGSSYISLFFYSKQYVKPNISENDPIRPLSPENNSLFSKLSEWSKASDSEETAQTQGPSSSVPLF